MHAGAAGAVDRELPAHVYDLAGYGDMIADDMRTHAYARALRAAITPGATVLDIGTGTGLFALLACRFGARHVYAVEPNDAIALAEEIARANGLGDRITFLQRTSDRIRLPEPVDVIVSDIRGILPMCGSSLRSIIDARGRWLAPGGTLIPARDRLMAAPIDAPRLYHRHVGPWEQSPHGLDMSAARRLVTNAWYRARAHPDELLAAPSCWATLDYTTLESPAIRGMTDWVAARAGTLFGASVWFESELGAGAEISNAPDRPELVYGAAFFPLSEPVTIGAGDRIEVSFRADPVDGDYVWSWTTTIAARQNPESPTARFEQSTFFSMPMARAELRKRAADHRPVLTEDGRMALLVLEAMAEGLALEDIAERLHTRFPSRFEDWHAAFRHACAFSGRYGEAPVIEGDALEPSSGDGAPMLSRLSNE